MLHIRTIQPANSSPNRETLELCVPMRCYLSDVIIPRGKQYSFDEKMDDATPTDERRQFNHLEVMKKLVPWTRIERDPGLEFPRILPQRI